jgi:ubiquinone/menaquinone biosynthesis C-methylase UbiE
MNWIHRRICRSDSWKSTVERDLVPWALQYIEPGARVLEIGPGPGCTTEVLRESISNLTALEIDHELAAGLRARMGARGVEVVEGDATRMPFASETFTAVVCFTMLHHVPSPALQDRVFEEVRRVLKPAGTYVGTDSRAGWFMSLIHIADTMVLLDPGTLAPRLQSAGFEDVHVDVAPSRLRFRARGAMAWRASNAAPSGLARSRR